MTREELAETEFRILTDAQIVANLKLFKKLSNENDPIGHYYLGSCYENGVGVEEDLCKGFELMKKASDANLPVAMYNVGLYYHYAMGVEENMSVAVEYYQKASNANYSRAHWMLGEFYEYGEGVFEIDMARAISFYKKAYKYSKHAGYDLHFSYIKKRLHHFTLQDLHELRNIAIFRGDTEEKEHIEICISNFKRSVKKSTKYIETCKIIISRYGVEKCAICFESLIPEDSDVYLTSCLHVFHHECVKNQTKCPLCREKLEEINIK